MKLLSQYLRGRQFAGLRFWGLVLVAVTGLTAVTSQTMPAIAPGTFGLYVVLPVLAVLLLSSVYLGQRSVDAGPASSQTRPEILLKTVIESTPSGLCIFDADLRVVISNSHFSEMYGLTPAQTRPGTSLRNSRQSRGGVLLPGECRGARRRLPRQSRFAADAAIHR